MPQRQLRLAPTLNLHHESGDTMNKKPDEVEEDDIPETDFSGGVRGKYYERARQGSDVVLLEPDVVKEAPGD